MTIKPILALGVGALVAATAVWAGGHGGNPAVKARQAHMQLYGHNLSVLGNMAKGDTEFNAEIAQAAADNLAALTMMSQATYWPQGTSSEDLPDESRALPASWTNWQDAMAKGEAMAEAAAAMQAAAGSLEGIQANIGAVGGACSACHKAYRAPRS